MAVAVSRYRLSNAEMEAMRLHDAQIEERSFEDSYAAKALDAFTAFEELLEMRARRGKRAFICPVHRKVDDKVPTQCALCAFSFVTTRAPQLSAAGLL